MGLAHSQPQIAWFLETSNHVPRSQPMSGMPRGSGSTEEHPRAQWVEWPTPPLFWDTPPRKDLLVCWLQSHTQHKALPASVDWIKFPKLPWLKKRKREKRNP